MKKDISILLAEDDTNLGFVVQQQNCIDSLTQFPLKTMHHTKAMLM